MPLIRYIHSPRTALAWYLLRGNWLLSSALVLALPLGLAMGAHVAGAPVALTMNDALFSPFYRYIFLLMILGSVVTHKNHVSTFQTLPIATGRYVRVESAVLGFVFALIGLLYVIGYLLAAKTAPPLGFTSIYVLATLGMLAQLGRWSMFPSTDSASTTLVVGVVMLLVAAGIFIGLHWNALSNAKGLPLIALCAIVAALCHGVTLRLADRHRHGSAAVAARSTRHFPAGELPATAFVQTKAPFRSPSDAQTWYELQFFGRRAIRNMYFLFIFPYIVFSYAFLLYNYLPGAPALPNLALGLSLVVVLANLYAIRDGFEFRLPASDWHYAGVRLRLAAPTLVIGIGVFFLLLGFLRQLDDGLPAAPSFDRPGSVLIALWVGWTGLALSPAIFCAVTVLELLFHGAPEAALYRASIAACYIYLAIVIVWAHVNSRHLTKPRLWPVLFTLLACCTVILVLPHLEGAAWANWILREVVSGAAIYAILRHHTGIGVVPRAAGHKMQNALAAAVLLSCLAASIVGPFTLPDKGVAVVFLAFGFVPALYLPLLIMPHFITLSRFRTDKNKEARRKAPWIY